MGKDVKDLLNEVNKEPPPKIGPVTDVPPSPPIVVKISWWEAFVSDYWYALLNRIKHNMEGTDMPEENVSLLDVVKGSLVKLALRWALKVGGGALLMWGLSSDDVTQLVTVVVGALLTVGVGVFQSLVQKKKDLLTPPPTPPATPAP